MSSADSPIPNSDAGGEIAGVLPKPFSAGRIRPNLRWKEAFRTHPLPVEEHVLLIIGNGRQALDMGFTAAIDAASAKPRLDIVIRNEINKGEIPVPACSQARRS